MSDKFIKWLFASFVSLLVITVVFGSFLINRSDKYVFKVQRENVELMYEGARADLVQCIDSTMRVYAPTTCMNGVTLLRECEEYGVDVLFVLAQGHKESHFGTKGMAVKTNSVFNVYAYDGHDFNKINKKGKYEHPDLSIKPYLQLLKNRYLVDGKSEIDLMHNYVDKDGNRYATSTEYEDDLMSLYQMYVSNKELNDRFQKYTKYKLLAGK